MADLGVAYWVDLPLEFIEHGCARGLFEEHWRVTFAIIRCSFLFTFQSKFAVRPRLRAGGFEAWVQEFQQRVNSKAPIRPGTLNKEQSDTDKRGKVIPLSVRDLAVMLEMSVSNVRRALKVARAKGLVLDGEPLYPDPKSAVLPPNTKKLKAEFFVVADQKLSLEFLPTDPKLNAAARERFSELSHDWKNAVNTLNAEFRKRFRAACSEFYILIPKRGRPKTKDSSLSAVRQSVSGTRTTTILGEETANAGEAAANLLLDPVVVELRKYGGDVQAARILVAACLKQAPDITAQEIVQFITLKGKLAVNKDNPVGFLLTAVPAALEGGGLSEWRKAQEQRPTSRCKQCDGYGIWQGEACPVCAGEGWL
jgi:hypothetical protein